MDTSSKSAIIANQMLITNLLFLQYAHKNGVDALAEMERLTVDAVARLPTAIKAGPEVQEATKLWISQVCGNARIMVEQSLE